MKNKLFIIFFFQNIFAQHDIPYDLSNQFGITLNNNQIVWNIDQKFDNLLIDSSSKYFKQKFSSFDFNDIKIDSTYTKSKFSYEFGDYGLDVLNVGLKKHSQDSDFQFLGFKKSFFGNYSEFANSDSSPLSLLYQFDYSKHFENHFLIVSVGYFQTSSSFLFDNLEDNSSNKEFSDFLSFTLIDRFEKGLWNYTFEFNHITKHDKLFLLEELLDNDIDIDRNILKINANNNKNVSIDLFLDNKFYFDLRSLQTIDDILQAYTQNSLHLVNSNSFKSSEIKYGFDYFMGNSPYKNDGSYGSENEEVLPNFYYELNHNFGNQTYSLSMDIMNKATTFLFDNPNYQEIETWNSINLHYNIYSGFILETNLKWTEVSNLTAYNKADNSFTTLSDDLLSLKTKFGISFNNHNLNLAYYHNFYDSVISSNRSDILDIHYGFKTSFVNEKLGVDGKISLIYLSKNNSDFSFDYFRNIPSVGNSFINDESYNIGINLDISIGDVILTFRANNLLHRLPINGDYSIERHELFNPINSLMSFGILWEFDD
jgi:hypothetical protein